ncbi:SEL1-like repeat protein [Pacificoceanicola onchidii]|uniref:SEL1-like repeat protein n=1 Tax=Pacificoceanicola onchidii TaxID=2562685 RepID=UPI0010A34C92|nr:tetratricopeptide repeat protein [Pacificoceanicola onchidii]
MPFSKSVLPLTLLLALSPLPALAQETAQEPLTMTQIEAAWAAGDFVTVREGLKTLAETEGTPFAMYRYGRVLIEGRGGPADLMGARDWLEKASTANQIDAMVLLARLYLSGAQGGPERNPERAVSLLKSAAARGNSEAQYYLGLLYARGTGITQSAEDAVTWFLASAENGNVSAMFELSRAYARGVGAEQNTEQAVRWLTEAAAGGHAEAQYFLSFALDSGQGLAQDRAQAANWLRRSAEAGFIRAQTALGRKYLKGDGLEQNLGEGQRWLQQAANSGDMTAMTDLADAFRGANGVTPNPALAMQFYSRAADAGYPRAMLGMARLLEDGFEGQPGDMEKAVEYYRKAVEAGSEEAILVLGQRAGEGKLDGLLAPHRAVPWAMAAAQNGDEAALAWLKARSDEGLRPARTALALWLLANDGDPAEASALLTTAAEAGDVVAQHQLGLAYMKGTGVEQDYITAHKWLNIAAAGGSSDALEMRGIAADLMTAEQVAEAQTAARQFFEQARPPAQATGAGE